MSLKTPIKLRRDYDDCWFEDADGNILEDDMVLALANAGARLIKTKDGVPHAPGDRLFLPLNQVMQEREGDTVAELFFGGDVFWMSEKDTYAESPADCYSTREAAEKARLA